MKANDQTEHEREVSTHWDYQEVTRQVRPWFDIFNAQFFEGKLPLPLLYFERTGRGTLGHYRLKRLGDEVQHEINLNRLHLNRPFVEVLATLLHEITHEWQQIFGEPGEGAHHNLEFTSKCAAMGIPCTGGHRSVSLGNGPPFVSLLRQHGVDAEIRVHMPFPAIQPKFPGR